MLKVKDVSQWCSAVLELCFSRGTTQTTVQHQCNTVRLFCPPLSLARRRKKTLKHFGTRSMSITSVLSEGCCCCRVVRCICRAKEAHSCPSLFRASEHHAMCVGCARLVSCSIIPPSQCRPGVLLCTDCTVLDCSGNLVWRWVGIVLSALCRSSMLEACSAHHAWQRATVPCIILTNTPVLGARCVVFPSCKQRQLVVPAVIYGIKFLGFL